MVYKSPKSTAAWGDEARTDYINYLTKRWQYADKLAEQHDRECELEELQLKRRRNLQDREIEGIACVYGIPDSFGTTWHPGCFAKAKPSEVKYRFNHDDPHYYGPVAEITLLYEIERHELPTWIQRRYDGAAKGGLVVVRRYFTDEKTNGPAAEANLKAGVVKWLSVSCTPLKTRRRTSDGQNILTDVYEAKLHDISDCDRPGAVPGVCALTGNTACSLLEGQYKRWD